MTPARSSKGLLLTPRCVGASPDSLPSRAPLRLNPCWRCLWSRRGLRLRMSRSCLMSVKTAVRPPSSLRRSQSCRERRTSQRRWPLTRTVARTSSRKSTAARGATTKFEGPGGAVQEQPAGQPSSRVVFHGLMVKPRSSGDAGSGGRL